LKDKKIVPNLINIKFDFHRLFNKDIELDEIYFISDIERFSLIIKKKLIKILCAKKIKLVVFLGDIFSFLKSYWNEFQVYDYLNKNKNNLLNITSEDFGNLLSELIYSKNKNEIDNFIDFENYCVKKDIRILFYSGNHDSILAFPQRKYIMGSFFNGDLMELNNYFNNIPIIYKIINNPNFYNPMDLELIYLNKDLYLTGVNSDKSGKEKYISSIDNSLRMDKKRIDFFRTYFSNKTIFVSHCPGITFYNLGSINIYDLKKKCNFKYHYHGHVKNYRGEYKEAGVLTLSVHYH